ncbi:DUF881 domain-containing protein [Halobacillus andaensis]|nr:DUF881 domain-containing protein [Halobacillus andaensis]MBP2003581.1 uncharacterized protein YlxW (UPF0749 family) [Halobacillus andaensis]
MSKLMLSMLLLFSGFLITFTYHQSSSSPKMVQLNEDAEWPEEFEFQQQLLELEKSNKQLREELQRKRTEVVNLEDEIANSEKTVSDYVNKKKQLQLLAGELSVEGEGVSVQLQDAAYIPEDGQVNDYIVHETHVFEVINELLSAGAKAVSVNGQRLHSDSYISCTGPVITVDGVQHPAPFVIEAIGNPDVLQSSLELTGGIEERLQEDHVDVDINVERVSIDARSTLEGRAS